MKYLFVSGAPRSGTSALTELLSSHSKVSLGMERFKYLYKKKKVKKESFSEGVFFSFSSDQTNIGSDSGKYVEYYKGLKRKYRECSIVGDKYPQLYNFWPSLFEEFREEGRYIFIVRNIDDVASSFNVRASNPKDKWPIENDYRKAVEIWNQSLTKAMNAIQAGENLFVVSYEELFDNSVFDCKTRLSEMMDYLDVEPSGDIFIKHEEMCLHYLDKVKNKEKTIFSGQLEYVSSNANYELYNQLMKTSR